MKLSACRPTRGVHFFGLALCLAVTLFAPSASGASTAWPRTVVAGFSTPDGGGYWLVRSDGSVTTNGDAHRYGDAAHLALHAPMVGGAATPTGKGYWLVASDGGVFTFGDARFYGSMGGVRLVRPVFFIARTPTGRGYWLFARDGGVFTFGDARFFGSASGSTDIPIVGVVTTPGAKGYQLLTPGWHLDFGKVLVPWPNRGYNHGVTIVSVAPTPLHRGFWALTDRGWIEPVNADRGLGPGRRAVPGGAKYIFSNPKRPGFIVIANSGALLRFGAAPGR